MKFTALVVSAAITLLALAMFGYVKGHSTGTPPLRNSLQTVLLGGVVAGVACMIPEGSRDACASNTPGE